MRPVSRQRGNGHRPGLRLAHEKLTATTEQEDLMTESTDSARAFLQHEKETGLHVAIPTSSTLGDVFVTAVPLENEPMSKLLERAAKAARDKGAAIIHQDVFGEPDSESSGFVEQATWPVTWVCEREGVPARPAGTQLWAVTALQPEPLEIDGGVAGCGFESEDALWCRLGGLTPPDPAAPRASQADAVFELARRALKKAGLDFADVVRTWFYNEAILDWYTEFNERRDVFFREHGVFEGLIPASTGMGGRNPNGTALTAGLLAIRPKNDEAVAQRVVSPLQNPATDYGSSFSRAAEVAAGGCRRLTVSGTASIGQDGKTRHLDDPEGQVALTTDVAAAILESRNMDWDCVTRFVAYYKSPEDAGLAAHDAGLAAQDAGLFETLRLERAMPSLPRVSVVNDVCRGDLLFEIELDAVAPFT